MEVSRIELDTSPLQGDAGPLQLDLLGLIGLIIYLFLVVKVIIYTFFKVIILIPGEDLL
jgi:hypothetical protein